MFLGVLDLWICNDEKYEELPENFECPYCGDNRVECEWQPYFQEGLNEQKMKKK